MSFEKALCFFYICCIFIPCSIISIKLIQVTIAKRIDLQEEKKLNFSIKLEILYHVVTIAYFYLLNVGYTYFTKESIGDRSGWELVPFLIVLVCILYFVQYLIINHIGEGELKYTTLGLVTICVFLINIHTIILLYVFAGVLIV